MTMSHMMNCPHMPEGWCLNCVAALTQERDALAATLQAFREKIETNFAVTIGFDNEPAAILAARDARVRAQVLRKAADQFENKDDFRVCDELDRMADAIEKEAGK